MSGYGTQQRLTPRPRCCLWLIAVHLSEWVWCNFCSECIVDNFDTAFHLVGLWLLRRTSSENHCTLQLHTASTFVPRKYLISEKPPMARCLKTALTKHPAKTEVWSSALHPWTERNYVLIDWDSNSRYSSCHIGSQSSVLMSKVCCRLLVGRQGLHQTGEGAERFSSWSVWNCNAALVPCKDQPQPTTTNPQATWSTSPTQASAKCLWHLHRMPSRSAFLFSCRPLTVDTSCV